MSDDSALPIIETSPSAGSDTIKNPDETKSDLDCPEVDYEVDVETYADSDTEENGKVTAKENPIAATDAEVDAETDVEVDAEGDPDADTEVDTEEEADAGVEVDPDVDVEADVKMKVGELAEEGSNENAELTVDDGVEVDAQLNADLFAACDFISSDELTEDSDENNEEFPEAKQEGELVDLYTIFLYIWTASIMVAIFVLGIMPYLYLNRKFDPRYSPLRLIPRSTWDTTNESDQQVPLQPYKAQRVAVVQTDTEQCDTLEGCALLILNIERDYPTMKYNFVISRAGNVYEVLGWSEPSPMYPDKPTMVVAFIGDYEFEQPSELQMEQLNILLAKSEENKYLSSPFTMIGRKAMDAPTKLFERLFEVEGLNWEDFDSEDRVPVECQPFLIDAE